MTKIAAATRKLPISTYLLSLGQAINLVAAVMSVTIAALVGFKLAPSPEQATVPYGIQFAAVMVFTYPAALTMQRYGRRNGFLLGALPLMLAGGVGYFAVTRSSFALLCLSHFCLGMYIAFANFYRFAAVDSIAPELKAKAISTLVSGGVLAAIAGPMLAMHLREVPGFPEYSLCYASLTVLGILTMALIPFWDRLNKKIQVAASMPEKLVGTPASLRYPLLVAIFASAGGYLIMNFLMIQSSLVMRENHVHFNSISHVIQLHVLAMFLPSFVTGRLIARIGVRNTLLFGFSLLAASTILGIVSAGYLPIAAALLLLGLGWNLTYVGGGAALAQYTAGESALRWQGINDAATAISATVGAFSPSFFLSLLGWQASNVICLLIAGVGLALCFKLKAA
ncbi:MAG: MFS transporter [Noviherbaspirillum sp.]